MRSKLRIAVTEACRVTGFLTAVIFATAYVVAVLCGMVDMFG